MPYRWAMAMQQYSCMAPILLCEQRAVQGRGSLTNSVMSGYIDEFVLGYLDYILVYSDNADEHELHLRKVFDHLWLHKL